VPRYDLQGEFLGYIGSCIDVTERKDAEADAQASRRELAHVNRATTLGELAGSIAHELNQPLSAILSNAQAGLQFLESGSADAKEMRDIFMDIVGQDRRAAEVIVRMRALLRKGEVQMQAEDLNQIIADVLKIMHSELVLRSVAIATRLGTDLPKVHADRIQLQQVLMNLIVNACDAMSANPAGERQLSIETEQIDASCIELSVRDCGHGLAREDLERVFEPFYTTKTTGLGLGLAICRTIIGVHGGRIWVANNKDRGATVRFTLRIHRQETPELK
jgi:C4-dicarboxylate-specific signal transduction histidine kinase